MRMILLRGYSDTLTTNERFALILTHKYGYKHVIFHVCLLRLNRCISASDNVLLKVRWTIAWMHLGLVVKLHEQCCRVELRT